MLIILLYGALTFYWFQLNGLYGSMAIGGIAIGLASIVIARSSRNFLYVVFSFILLSTLVGVQELSTLITSGNIGFMPVSYLIFGGAIFGIVYYLKAQYDKERTKIVRQSQDLKKQSDELKQSIREKEAYIQKLNETRDQLVESEKMASVGRLTAGLAHELNNPLNFVSGNIDPINADLEEIKKSQAIPQNQGACFRVILPIHSEQKYA